MSTILPLVFFLVLWPLVGMPWISFLPLYGVALLISWVSSSFAMMVSAAFFDIDT